MRLQGYVTTDVTPWENASGGKGIECKAESCTATFQLDRSDGWYELDLQYFDLINGDAKFRLYVGDQLVDQWIANDHLPARTLGGDASTRRWISGLALRKGDTIRIEGIPDGDDRAAMDYVAIHPMNASVIPKK
jgi:alpha-glucuronidase